MSGYEHLTVGDEVRVLGTARRNSEPNLGKITRVGRTLLDVEDGYGHKITVSRSTGVINDNYGRTRIRTFAEAEEVVVREDALKTLATIGVNAFDVERRHPTALLVDLAAVVTKHREEKDNLMRKQALERMTQHA